MSNYGTFRRRTSTLPIVIGVIVAFSMFPVSWLGWTSDVADLVRVPITPVSHVGMMLTSWVRPAVTPSDLPTDEQERSEFAIAERDLYKRLYLSQNLRITELSDQLRLLQSLPESALRNPQPPLTLTLDVTGMQPSNVGSMIELKLVRGAVGRILDGDIAVVGQDIVGRIARVGMTRIELLPTTSKEIGLIRAAIVPAHPSGRPPLLAKVLLQSRGDGTMFTQAPATSTVQVGDLVILDDPSWPRVGSGMTLGIVKSVHQLDAAPLRQAIEIVPRRSMQGLARVVVLGTGQEQAP